jgi:hypothetical protein
MPNDSARRARSLSYDEAKAAEAAFQGQPFDDAWSETARAIYDGILDAMLKRRQSVGPTPLLAYQPAEGEGLEECSVSQGDASWGSR